MKDLLLSGIDINSLFKDTDYRFEKWSTALEKAMYWSSPSFIKLLIDKGADVHLISDDSNDNILHILSSTVADKETLHVMEADIIPRDVDVNAQDDSGRTPLHGAIHVGPWQNYHPDLLPEVTMIYLLAGADVNIEDERELTPLESVEEKYQLSLDYTEPRKWDYRRKLPQAREIIRQHVIKLKVAGLYVSDKNFKLANSIKSRPQDFLMYKDPSDTKTPDLSEDDLEQEYFNRSRYEAMKTVPQNAPCGDYSVYEYELEKLESELKMQFKTLLTIRNPDYLGNNELYQRLNDLETARYPIYGELAKHKFERDRRRFLLLKECETMAQRIKPTLPVEIWHKILSLLNNEDLRRVVKSLQDIWRKST